MLVNPLLFDGYGSVGCAPCTRRITAGEDARAGRWAGTCEDRVRATRLTHRPARPAGRIVCWCRYRRTLSRLSSCLSSAESTW